MKICRKLIGGCNTDNIYSVLGQSLVDEILVLFNEDYNFKDCKI